MRTGTVTHPAERIAPGQGVGRAKCRTMKGSRIKFSPLAVGSSPIPTNLLRRGNISHTAYEVHISILDLTFFFHELPLLDIDEFEPPLEKPRWLLSRSVLRIGSVEESARKRKEVAGPLVHALKTVGVSLPQVKLSYMLLFAVMFDQSWLNTFRFAKFT